MRTAKWQFTIAPEIVGPAALVFLTVVLLTSGIPSFAEDKGFCPPAPPVRKISHKPNGGAQADTVTLQTVISDKGFVCNVQVLRGLDKETDAKAIAAVRQWHFDPAMKNGHAVPVVVAVDIRFALGPDGKVVHTVQSPMATRIPAPDPKKYQDVRDGRDWKNPYLIIRADGIEIVGRTPAGQVVPIESLRNALEQLPESAWPYGLVVAIQEIGVRTIGKGSGEDARISANTQKVEQLLAELGITVNRWPSA